MVWAPTVPEMDDVSSCAVWSRGVSCRPVENEKRFFAAPCITIRRTPVDLDRRTVH